MRELTGGTSRAWARAPGFGHLTVLASILALVVTVCTGGGPTPGPSPTTPQPRRGGEAVFGAEQWPECVNPITSCAAATWTHWSVLQHVLPRAMEIDPSGNYVASPLLTHAPTLANGGVEAGPPFRVRLRISPDAVWDDGTPITVRDFRFTWHAQLETPGAYYPDDYEHIRAIESSDRHDVQLVFDQVAVDWPELFGGASGYVLKKDAFSGIGGRAPTNLRKEMLDNIPFSGGPFRLAEWSSNSAVLVRNEHYFGKSALLDKMTMFPLLDQTAALEAIRDGWVSAIFPQLSWDAPGIEQALGYHPKIEVAGGDGIYLEAMWFNHDEPPLDDPMVRQAIMYAIDRQAIVDRFIKPYNPKAEVLNCGLVAFPRLGPWCAMRPFERFSYNPEKARGILEEAGYNCSATFCTKDGALLEVQYSIVSTNLRRAATQQLQIDQFRAAGISVRVENYGTTGYFSNPRSNPIGVYSWGGDLDPSVTELFGCDEFPNSKKGLYRQNYSHWCNRQADWLMKRSDQELDPVTRLALMNRIYELQAADFVALPLHVLPTVSAWRTDKIAGPIGLYSSTPHGMLFNMNEWYVPA